MHPMYSKEEIKRVRTRLVGIQKELIEMRYEFTPEELTGLYSVVNRLEDLEWHQDYAQEQQGYVQHQSDSIQSDRLRQILREWTEEVK